MSMEQLLAFLIIGFAVWIFSRKAGKATQKTGYTATPIGHQTRFDVTTVPSPFPFDAAFLMSIPFFGFLYLSMDPAGRGAAPIFGILILAIPIFVLAIWLGPKATKHRSVSTLLADPEGIDFGGNRFQARDIHRLVLRNHFNHAEVGGHAMQGPTVAYDMGTVGGAVGAIGHSVGAGLSAAGQAVGSARLRKMQSISWRLDMDCRGTPVTLAGGMTETTAFGLMTEIGRILGMQ